MNINIIAFFILAIFAFVVITGEVFASVDDDTHHHHHHRHHHHRVARRPRSSTSSKDCQGSDLDLLHYQATLCTSISGPTDNECCNGNPFIANATAAHDWPSQAIYMANLWNALLDPSTCLDTPIAASVVSWLAQNYSNPNISCSFINTWVDFQFGYYKMPVPSTAPRVESPATLGAKCWAFAELAESWNPIALQRVLAPHNLALAQFQQQVNLAIPRGFTLCNEVAANCFLNKAYNPSTNGTCHLSIDEFKLGFDLQNLKHHLKVKDPYYLA